MSIFKKPFSYTFFLPLFCWTLCCQFILNAQNQSLFFENPVLLIQEPNGALWMGKNDGLVYFNPETKKQTFFRAARGIEGNLQSDTIHHLFLDDQKLYLATNAGFEIYDKEKNTFQCIVPLDSITQEPIYYPLHYFFKDKEQKIWMSGPNGGLRSYDALTQKASSVNIKTDDKEEQNAELINIIEDYQQVLWLLDSLNIWRLSKDRTQLDKYAAMSIEMGVGKEKNKTIYQGKSGTVWIATPDVLRFDPKEVFFRFYQFFNSDWNADAVVEINDLYQDEEGIVWCATGKGWYRYDLEQGDTTNFYSQRHIMSIAPIENGEFILSNWGTAFHFNPVSGQTLELFSKDENFKMGRTLDARIDQDGDLWIATDGAGVFHVKKENWNKETGEISVNKQYVMAPQYGGISANHLFSLFVDSKNLVWVCVDVFGLSRVDKNSHPVKIFSYDPNNPYSISSGYTKAATEDKEGNIWITTEGNGLNKYDPKTEQFTRYDVSHGLQDNNLNRIAIDKEGKIWVTTSQGLSRLDPVTETFTNYDQTDGLISWESALFANKKTGDMLVGGAKGFHAFNIYELQSPIAQASPIELANLSYFNAETETMIKVLPNKIPDNRLILSYQENIIEVDFAILDLFNQVKHSYQYSLVSAGETPQWTPLGDQNQVRLVNLDVGNYIFSVKGRNSLGVWSELEKPIYIDIRPPWWNTKAAYLGYFILISALLFWGYRFQLHRQKEKTEAQQLKAMDELKTRFYTNITHEFRTPLTVILGMVSQLKTGAWSKKVSQKEQSRLLTGFELIHRNSKKLLHLINQLLDLSKLDTHNFKPYYQAKEVVSYIQYVGESFQSMAERKGVRLAIYSEINQLIMDVDEDIMQQIIANLLSNAIKFTAARGKVVLHLSQKDTQLFIKVKDTGEGISEEALPHIFDRFYQVDNASSRQGEGTGIGLALVQELVDLLDGTIEVTSTVGKGTTFLVVLPIEVTSRAEQSEKGDVISTQSSNDKTIQMLNKDLKHSPKIGLEMTSRSSGTGSSFSLHSAQDVISKPQLLITEDNPDVIFYIQSILAPHYQIDIAQDGQAGIDKALEQVPDIIISDVMMPKKNGFELVETLKQDERTSHIPIILLTAKATQQDKLAGLKYGADAYLMKPFDKEELFVRLEKLLEVRQALQRRYSTKAVTGLQSLLLNAPKTIEDIFLEKLHKVLEKNYENSNFSIKELAKAMQLSYHQFNRKLKALTDKTPALYLRSFRLHKAKELLLGNNDLNVSEVAYEVGFDSPNYFSRAFSEEFGRSPNEVKR